MATDIAWELDHRLAADGVAVGDFALSRVLLMNNAHFPWLVLVPRRAGAIEIIDLVEDDQRQLMSEIAQSSRALKGLTGCDKLNVAALGNTVAQLHVHVIARFRNDAAGPRPIWGEVPQLGPRSYTPEELSRLLHALRRELPLAEALASART